MVVLEGGAVFHERGTPAEFSHGAERAAAIHLQKPNEDLSFRCTPGDDGPGVLSVWGAGLQGCLTYKNTHSPRTLPWAYA